LTTKPEEQGDNKNEYITNTFKIAQIQIQYRKNMHKKLGYERTDRQNFMLQRPAHPKDFPTVHCLLV